MSSWRSCWDTRYKIEAGMLRRQVPASAFVYPLLYAEIPAYGGGDFST